MFVCFYKEYFIFFRTADSSTIHLNGRNELGCFAQAISECMVAAMAQKEELVPAFTAFCKSLDGHFIMDIRKMVSSWFIPNSPQLDHATSKILRESLLYAPLPIKLQQLKREDLIRECLGACAPYFSDVLELQRSGVEYKLTSVPSLTCVMRAINPTMDKPRKRQAKKNTQKADNKPLSCSNTGNTDKSINSECPNFEATLNKKKK